MSHQDKLKLIQRAQNPKIQDKFVWKNPSTGLDQIIVVTGVYCGSGATIVSYRLDDILGPGLFEMPLDRWQELIPATMAQAEFFPAKNPS